MSTISDQVKTTLEEVLYRYYDALKHGDMLKLSALMTRGSYQLMLESLGFKRAFRDDRFNRLLKSIDEDADALKEVESVLSADLAAEARDHEIKPIDFESKGTDRISLRFTEDGHPKQLYFSSPHGVWTIDYKAGRQTTIKTISDSEYTSQ